MTRDSWIIVKQVTRDTIHETRYTKIMSKILIKNGRVIDPASKRDEVKDVLIEDDKITQIGTFEPDTETQIIDAAGKLVIPGAIDLHVHLRDLEQGYKETIEFGTLAARKGGVTTVFAMPNTKPPLDNPETIKKYQAIINSDAVVETHIAAAITKREQGKELAAVEEYPSLGIKFITDDGSDVNDEELLTEAYKKAKELGLILATHPEMDSIAPDGVINEGEVSKKLNVPGQPNEKEYKAIERGIRIAKKVGAKAHFTHISTKESVELIRQVKKESDLITCDATPHHFSLTDEIVLEKEGMAKVNPPLRTEEDRLAVIEGIKDGTVDDLITDHAPHSMEEKELDVLKAAYGFSGLEILIPAALTELYHNQKIDLMRVIELMTINPATLAGLKSGRIQEGAKADITIIDLEQEKKVDSSTFVSKGKNTPFNGMVLKGWPVMTIFGGKVHK